MQVPDKELLQQYEALVKFFIKKELKIKEAVCFDKRVRYFRNDDLIEFIQAYHADIPRILKQWTFDKSLEDEGEARKFVTDLLENKILLRLERGPEEPKYKWPKKLYPSKDQSTQSDTAFYSFVINPKSKSSRLYTLLIIGAVIAVCLFQIWPLKLKLAVFYTSVILLYVLIGLILVRLAIYTFFRVLGFNAYVFPNLFEEVSFLDSFKPFFSFEKCEDGTIGYVARGFGLVMLAFLMYKLSQEPEIIDEYRNIGTQSFDDIINWGMLKLEGKSEVVDPRAEDLRRRINDLLDAVDEDEKLDQDKDKVETEGQVDEKLAPVEDVDVDKFVQDAMEGDRKLKEEATTAQETVKETTTKTKKSKKAKQEQEVN